MWTWLSLAILAQLPPDGAAQLRKVDRLLPALQKVAQNPVVVREVKRQNARRVPLATLQRLDEQWQSTPGPSGFRSRLLENSCSDLLRTKARVSRAVVETFVMDNQGALVGSSNRTSDYWQGDEALWSVPFEEQKVLRSKPTFDESTQSYVIQVSLPVRDGRRIIGAISFGISLLEL
jgi:hypothetical protein